MNLDKSILRLGATVILAALIFRLLTSYLPPQVTPTDAAAALLYLQTGRLVKVSSLLSQETLPEPEETVPSAPAADPVVFTPSDAALIQLNDYASADPDIAALLLQPLAWDLTGGDPQVLIYHTHGSESYENTENYPQTAAYRTLDTGYNMVSIGDRVTAGLEEAGISVCHDRSIHDSPSYNSAYSNSRASAQAILETAPSICLVLDLHRDAAQTDSGGQVRYAVATPAGEAAKVMLVVGTGHEGWEDNLALALKLQVTLEKLCPGICRPLTLRSAKYNQQLSPGALLIEVGTAGNTRQEALLTADLLVQAIDSLKAGSTS